jgi:hypothetical protein
MWRRLNICLKLTEAYVGICVVFLKSRRLGCVSQPGRAALFIQAQTQRRLNKSGLDSFEDQFPVGGIDPHPVAFAELPCEDLQRQLVD